MLDREIDPVANEEAIERIRVTFDELVGANGCYTEVSNSGRVVYRKLPEDLLKPSIVKSIEGDLVYGLTEDGVEAVAVYHAMGWVIFCRNGTTIVPDGVDGPVDLADLAPDERYDTWYTMLSDFVRVIDMPDRILEPLDDEIDVEAGFGDADADGEPLDPNDD
jgi:hypothetical protein